MINLAETLKQRFLTVPALPYMYIDAFCQDWFHLAQLFQRSRLKYEKVNGRTTYKGRRTDDGRQVMAIPHMTLWWVR
jgi:hypothetical protein